MRSMKYKVKLNGKKYEVEVEMEGEEFVSPIPVEESERRTPLRGSKIVEAQMPGVVISIAVKPGEIVKEKQELLILESMKMENEIFCPFDGVVSDICVKEGVSVKAGNPLITLD